jgi:Ca2+-transporting ATPase
MKAQLSTTSSNALQVTGLHSTEAARRLKSDGPNEVSKSEPRSVFKIAVGVLREPMLSLLLLGGIVYALLGELAEALVLLVFATFSVAVTIVQELRSEHVLEALRNMSAPRAMVVRDGRQMRVAGRDVVVGDVLVLDQGDRVAADAILMTSNELHVDESLLTGESLHVRKLARPRDTAIASRPGGDDQPFVYSGTMIVRGGGVAEVIATGANSEIGRIGESVAKLQPAPPRLRTETRRIVRYCALAGIAVSLSVMLLYGLNRGGWLEAVLAGIAIGMSVLPEEFAVVLTVFFAMGAWRIAQAGVLTRRAAAIETLGSATVLCADKTGTLTENRMAVARLWNPQGEWDAGGDWHLLARPLQRLVLMAQLASAPLPVDPMEVAFHDAAKRLVDPPHRGNSDLLHSYGLRPDLLAMSNVWSMAEGGQLIAAKGAPEVIAELCHLDAAGRKALNDAVDVMANRGMRVLGVAEAVWSGAVLPESQRDHSYRLLGLVGLSDPLRPAVPGAIGECRRAGIRVVMITGDYPATARFIADSAGLGGGELLSGEELRKLDDRALAGRLGEVSVFARIMPNEKLRLVEAFRARGDVVAMTGDGVNDAPSLKAADIGIAMGQRGTDVAREASTIVLLNDDFGSIVTSIRLGRRIYDNLRKAMAFIFAVHVPIAGLALFPLLLGYPLLLAPVHIALLEMIIDPVCALVFEAEREEKDVMRRPPRAPHEPLFSRRLVAWSLGQGAMALGLIGTLWLYVHFQGRTDDEVRGIVFFALLASTLVLIVANLTFGSIVRASDGGRNRTLPLVFVAVAGMTALAYFSPGVRGLLKIGVLVPFDLLAIAGTAAMLLLILQLLKPLARPRQGGLDHCST